MLNLNNVENSECLRHLVNDIIIGRVDRKSFALADTSQSFLFNLDKELIGMGWAHNGEGWIPPEEYRKEIFNGMRRRTLLNRDAAVLISMLIA